MRVRLESVKKAFQGRDGNWLSVLNGVNLEISDGELVVVMGPSGSGKTTLLHIVGGLLSCDCGAASVGPVSVTSVGKRDRDRFRNQHVGFIFQGQQLVQSLDLVDNVMLPWLMSARRVDERAVRARAIHLLESLGLGDRLSHKPHQLSTEQDRRTAIARSLINDPSVLIADEPTSRLDQSQAIQILAILKQLSRQGRSVLVATRNWRVAETADRYFLLEDGHLSDSVSNWVDR